MLVYNIILEKAETINQTSKITEENLVGGFGIFNIDIPSLETIEIDQIEYVEEDQRKTPEDLRAELERFIEPPLDEVHELIPKFKGNSKSKFLKELTDSVI